MPPARLDEIEIVPWTERSRCRTLSDIVIHLLERCGVATERLSVRIDANLKRSLKEEARRERRSASWLAVEAIEALLRGREEKRAAIRAALDEADRGAFISRDAMDAWISSWGSDPAGPPPEPDIRSAST